MKVCSEGKQYVNIITAVNVIERSILDKETSVACCLNM